MGLFVKTCLRVIILYLSERVGKEILKVGHFF